MMLYSILEGFTISPLINLIKNTDTTIYYITNYSIYTIMIVVMVLWFCIIFGYNRFYEDSLSIFSNEIINDLILYEDTIGEKNRKFLPYIFTLFFLICFSNLSGLIPYVGTITSHLAVTFGLACSTFIGLTLKGLVINRLSFFSFFVPKGVPSYLVLLVMFIEIVSYLFRPISLSLRLFANIMAGHILIKILVGFIQSLLGIMILKVLVFLPQIILVLAILILVILEISISILQAYVFTLLVCMYIHDAIYLH